MKKMLIILAALSLVTGTALANPETLAGGVMIAHHPAGLAYTSDAIDWCAEYNNAPLTDSAQQNNMITGVAEDAFVWYVVAAFAEDKVWCGTQFGLGDFNADMFYIDGYGACLDANLEIPTSNWPGPNEGTAVVATTTQWSGNYQAVYWFGGYCYGETVVALDVDPSVGFIGFGNCEAPSQTWDAQGGAMGIFTDGVAVHPEVQEPPQACCDEYGACELLIAADCEASGGIVDDSETCDPNPCAVLVRACCLENGDCVILLPADCVQAGGVPEDVTETCDPNPCPQPEGACCMSADCVITTEAGCQGDYQGDLTTCDPNPCEVTATDDASWGTMKSMYR